MCKAIMWALLWFAVKWVLQVSAAVIEDTIAAVKKAENLTDENGDPVSGEEKKKFVMSAMWESFLEASDEINFIMDMNIIIELAVKYVKTYLEGQFDESTIE